jgi:F-type H+-transporting ATPase subunit b
MNLRKAISSSLIVCGASLFLAAAALAVGEGGTHPAEPTELFRWINFAIVAGALIWALVKILPPKFRLNAENINSAITKAQAVKTEADRKLKEVEQRLAKLEEEVQVIREEARKDAAAEAGRIRALAKSDLEKVAIAAKAEIEAAERAARLELKAIAAKLAVDRAELLVAQRLTPQTQDALIAGFVKSLNGSRN